MSIARKIEDGTLTLGTLSKLVTSNKVLSEEWKIKLTWGFKLGKLYGKVTDGPFVVQEKFYEGEYTHILLAKMHYDFSLALQPLIEAKQRAIRLASLKRKKGDDDTPTMGERADEIRERDNNK